MSPMYIRQTMQAIAFRGFDPYNNADTFWDLHFGADQFEPYDPTPDACVYDPAPTLYPDLFV